MAANGISTLATKELRQKAKLDLASQKKVARGDPAPYYDITLLPTQYSGNDVVDNPNSGGLKPGRPWISDPDVVINNIELETGDDLLLETSDFILLET